MNTLLLIPRSSASIPNHFTMIDAEKRLLFLERAKKMEWAKDELLSAKGDTIIFLKYGIRTLMEIETFLLWEQKGISLN
ncbi:MAG: hypothetical protein WC878_00965 [Candidatus Paceibacterota bacterium]